MKIYDTPAELLGKLRMRDERGNASSVSVVSDIIDNVRKRGDEALREYSAKFDEVSPENIELSLEELDKIAAKCPAELAETISRAAENIREYHKRQLESQYEFEIDGKRLGRVIRPLKRVGVYIPGGTAAYPSTVLMNCVPASVAGVDEIIAVTPPKKEGISPAVAMAAKMAGVNRIFMVGGAQAVAALAYGTETIPVVDKIVGPGNMFVSEAKRQVFGKVDIDMIAGPSEVLVIADETANPKYLAADLLSQLEHDPMASAVLLTTSRELVEKTIEYVDTQLEALSRKNIASRSLEDWSGAVILDSIAEAVDIANSVAPEHCEIVTENPFEILPLIRNAGSVFLGEYSPEPMGDYFAGTNHVLPTNGAARFASPLSVDDFVKKMSWLCYDKKSFLREAEDVIRFAESEGLGAHANSVRVRLEK